MYMCLDTQRLYYDETDNKRVTYGYTGVNTRNDLMYYITPTYGMTYYCWEDNSLWLWNNKWVALYSDGSYPDAYVYDDNRNIIDVYGEPNTPVDTNGLLKDGSVVIRDRNRIIKGKIFIEESNDNMTISSFLGGGIRLLPNGKMTGDGELFIGDVPRVDSETGETVTDTETGEILYDTKATVRAAFSILNNEGYIDYSETPQSDPSEYPNSEHKYEIFHSGNLDVSAIKVITPQDIYSKLQDPSLPSPLDLNVKKIDGHPISEISLVGHTHSASNITDFNNAARQQALVQINDVFSRMTGEGISVSYNSQSQTFRMTANPFTITLTGGVSGSGLVSKLSDTNIQVDVDPSKHIHQNYINTMTDLQDQINAIVSVDPQNYYNKIQVDNMISSIEATDIATAGKPLKINNNLILPATSQSTNSLANPISIELQGDVTGTISTDLSSNVIITTNANNILSQLPEQGKALAIDAQGNLPANADTASALNHNLRLIFTGEVDGSVNIDTSLNQNTINLTLNPGNNIVQSSDLGVTVATLGNDGKLTPSQLPASQLGLVPKGNWNPETGAPSNAPVEGQFWIANSEGTFAGKLFQVNDWCLWYDGEWKKIDTNDNVLSVNGQTGEIQLRASDINALSTSYIDYTVGDEIPQNKIVVTSQNGTIEGASVSKLTSQFAINTDNGSDVEISSSSSAASSNGSTNFGLKLDITQSGYENIRNNAGYNIYSNGNPITYQNILELSSDFKVLELSDRLGIDLNNYGTFIFWNGSNEDDEFLERLQSLIDNKDNDPVIISCIYDYNMYFYVVDSNIGEIADTDTKRVKPDHVKYILDTETNNVARPILKRQTNTLKLDFIGGQIRTLTIESNIDKVTEYISTDGDANTDAYIPTHNCNPATKKYVDDSINNISLNYYIETFGGDSEGVYRFTHDLDASDVITIIRKTSNAEQIYDFTTKLEDENHLVISIPNDESNTDNYYRITIVKIY